MGKTLILNGSPRAPKSNSKRLAALFAAASRTETAYAEITNRNHDALRAQMASCSDLLLVFPLYADALPVGLLNFLKYLEEHPLDHRPTLSVLINCGFLEYQQNEIAIRMLRLFSERNGYPFGSVLMIDSGEAILDSPFRPLVRRQIRRLARSIERRRYRTLHTTMPLPRKVYLAAATQYWLRYGQRFGTSRRQMETMQIEA